MSSPAQRLFELDLEGASYRAGVVKGLWEISTPQGMPGIAWPRVLFWLKAAPRDGAPSGYFVMTELTGYRTSAPTGTFWNADTNGQLEVALRPKGKTESRFARVFRTDWEDGRAFYHPFDRVAADGHPEWKSAMPHLVWSSDHTIVDFLEEFQNLLMSEDYLGR